VSDPELSKLRDAAIRECILLYKKNAQEFPLGTGEGAYERKMLAAYPIHPDLFERLYEDWSTLDKFQPTRGVLRLLARVINRLWEGQDRSLLIMPSSIPLDDGTVRSELTRYLPDVWEPIITQDVDGVESMPAELDRTMPTLGRVSAARRVARAIYMGTAPGSDGKNPGIDDRSVRLGCVQPGEAVATFGDALRRVSDRAKYIHQDQNRYWISTKPISTAWPKTAPPRCSPIPTRCGTR
jgi:predicted AAA+ superfamily ATPase